MISPGRSWREFPQRYRLEAAKCEACEKIHYPPRVVCSKCGGSTFENITLPREGKVVTFTIVRVPPAGFTEQTPLPIAIVEVMDGVRIMVQIGDLEDPSDLSTDTRQSGPDRLNRHGLTCAQLLEKMSP